MVHPWRCDYLAKTASNPGYTAKKIKEQKDEKYQDELHKMSSAPSLILLEMEYFGRWGEKAEIYLSDLSKRSRNEEGYPNPAEFKILWRKQLSLQLQPMQKLSLMRWAVISWRVYQSHEKSMFLMRRANLMSPFSWTLSFLMRLGRISWEKPYFHEIW